jgi:CRISPR/Cas system endoribonuclease Cas6 (RAMP superfamily)
VVPNQDVSFNIPQEKSLDSIIVRVKYKGPIYAPIKKGDKIAKLLINAKGHKVFEYDLFAKETVEQSGYFRKVSQILRYKVRSFINKFSKK